MRVPPHDQQAERELLGSALVDPEVLDVVDLPPEAYYLPSHRKIWQVMRALHAQGRPVDLVTVSERLQREGWLDEVGGPTYLVGLSERAGTAAHARHYAEIVRRLWTARRLIHIAGEAIAAAYDADEPLEVAGQLEQALIELDRGEAEEPPTLADAAAEAYEHWRAVRDGDVPAPLTLGVPGLERAVFLEPGDLMMLLASTGVGKSVFSLQVAQRAARNGWPTVYYSLEMVARQHGERALAQLAGVQTMRARTGHLAPAEEQNVQRVLQQIASLPMWLEHRLDTIEAISADLRRRVRKQGVRFAVIDYLGLMESAKKDERNYLKLQRLTAELKRLAVTLRIPILVVHQLNREAETEKPTMKNIADSYGATRNADVVAAIWRPRLGEDGQLSTEAHFIVMKNRSGQQGEYVISYDPRTVRFGAV